MPFLKLYFRSLMIKDALKTLVHAVVDIGLTEPSLDNLRCAPSRCFFPKVSMYSTLYSVPPVSCFITVALVALTIPSSEPEHNEFFFTENLYLANLRSFTRKACGCAEG